MVHKLLTISLVCVVINGILCDPDWRPIGAGTEKPYSAAEFASRRIGGIFIEPLDPAFWKIFGNGRYLFHVWFRAYFGDEFGIRRCWAEVYWNEFGRLTLNESYCTIEDN